MPDFSRAHTVEPTPGLPKLEMSLGEASYYYLGVSLLSQHFAASSPYRFKRTINIFQPNTEEGLAKFQVRRLATFSCGRLGPTRLMGHSWS